MPEMSLYLVILLYVIGLALIVAEMFVPGMILGSIGFLMVLAAIYFGFDVGIGWTLLLLTLALIPVLIWLWVFVLGKVLAIKETQRNATSAQPHLKALVGEEGVALTSLRPAGTARIGGKKVDVMTEGGLIDRDARVKVVRVDANRVVVREVTA